MTEQQAGEETEVRNLPRFAVLHRGTQRVRGRVLDYQGNGYFTVLIRGDIRLHIHRDRLTFTKG